jgi:hypothetical protein
VSAVEQQFMLTIEVNFTRNAVKRSDVGWEATWYKDIKTGKCTPAWSESLEFIGRDLNQV